MKFPVANPFYLFFLHFFLIILICCECYTPPDNIALNCGTSGLSSSPDGRIWTGDIPYIASSSGKPNFRSSKPSPLSTLPYDTASVSQSEFTYAFRLRSSGPIFIRLHFFPSSYQDFASSKAFFSVKANQFTLTNFSAYAVTAEEHMVKEYCIYVGEDKSVKITFTPSHIQPGAYAFINGIEIVSMPPDLYYVSHRERDNVGNKNGRYNLPNDTALEMVLRLNVGGGFISPMKDTGMYRSWQTDDEYVNDGGAVPVGNTTELRFIKIANYCAPNELYSTARTMGPNRTKNQSYNLTWSLPLDPQSQEVPYLVRLHFCEFQPEINSVGDRIFIIYMANLTAEEHADVISWTGNNGRDIPIYKDYFVYINPGEEKKHNFLLALQTGPVSETGRSDVILNGLEVFKLSDSDYNPAGPNLDLLPLFPIAPPNPTSRPGVSKMLIAVIFGGALLGVVSFSVFVFYIFRRRRRAKGSIIHNGSKSSKGGSLSLPANTCRCFSLAEIISATNNFDGASIVGRGGFGDVYKGYIDGGATTVAIKRLKSDSQQGFHEFLTEIKMLSQLRHLHLVSLIGYCIDNSEMILVYEYMSHGTLRDHLYNTDNPPLSWKQRLQICIGAAKGLHYLHVGAKHMIIHRDVKTTNVLLDDKWVAKVSDFGLARMNPNDLSKTHISTAVKGSIGYLDPEYYRFQQLTEKSDVYSFGVVLFEVLCGRPPVNRMLDKDQVSLVVWVRKAYRNGTIIQIIDPHLKGKIGRECLKKFVEVALSCLHDSGMERPSMNDVVWSLEFALELQETDDGEGMELDEIRKEVDHIDLQPLPREDEIVLMSDGHVSSNGITTTSTGGTSFTGSSGNQMSSGAVFSEIMNPTAR